MRHCDNHLLSATSTLPSVGINLGMPLIIGYATPSSSQISSSAVALSLQQQPGSVTQIVRDGQQPEGCLADLSGAFDRGQTSDDKLSGDNIPPSPDCVWVLISLIAACR